MKNVNDLKNEKQELIDCFNQKHIVLTTKEAKKEAAVISKKILFLDDCIAYLETESRACFIEKQITSIVAKIELLKTRAKLKNTKTKRQALADIGRLKQQLKTLQYVLYRQ